jgi:hypothetical protein
VVSGVVSTVPGMVETGGRVVVVVAVTREIGRAHV